METKAKTSKPRDPLLWRDHTFYAPASARKMETKATTSKPRDPLLWREHTFYAPAPAYTPPERPAPTEKDVESAREQNTRTAKLALAYYNAKHRTKFELVDAISHGFIGTRGIWFHCNFNASSGSGALLFFAELKIVKDRSGVRKEVVTACRPLTGAKTKAECCWCKGSILHPTRGFKQGCYEHQPRRLRPRFAGKVRKNLA